MDTVSFIKEYLEAWNNHDLKSIRKFYSPQISVVLNPDPLNFQEKFIGVDLLLDMLREEFQSFPDFKFTISDIIADDSRVSCMGVYTGTQTGIYKGISPTNKYFVQEASLFYYVENRKIVKIKRTVDNLSLYLTLGHAAMKQGNPKIVGEYLEALKSLGLIPST